MTTLTKLTAVGAVLASLFVGTTFVSAQGIVLQEEDTSRLCLRNLNRSLTDTSTEGEEAYQKAESLGNRCYIGLDEVGQIPAPALDPLTGDYRFFDQPVTVQDN